MNNTQQTPAVVLTTNFSLAKYFWLGLVTFGIYDIVMLTKISNAINTAASPYDGKKTMNYLLVFFVFSWLTLGIVPIVWYHKISGRIGRELQRRGINYNFGAKTYWLWNVLGACIVCGPFIYIHKLSTSMNLIDGDFNTNGK